MPDTPNPEPTPANTETTPQTGTGAVDDAIAWISPGSILGDRYEIRSLLGHGGMGEVWHASDLKLRVEVALKSLRPEFVQSERRRDLLRTEVRTAREVVSPNVCRVYDLVVEDGHELLSMEFIDGITLLQLLKDRGPLGLRDASELASQFLAGLDAVHEAGLVHRDFKPENVMITRAGRVVVMDFGIAKSVEAETGTIIGTPAYMAPEQLRGGAVDARTDVFAAGVVLAEMISEGGVKERKTREHVWKGIREDPPKLPDSPWAPVLRRAVAADPRDRYPTARALVRALEEVTLRVAGSEDKHPYPGLAAFTEADAEHFFGRESEVEVLLRKLGRPRLLGIVGPSGAGKSSLLGAGLIPALPEGWGHIRASPGDKPFAAVARALVPRLSDDPEALAESVGFEEIDVAVSLLGRWRKRHTQAILILDQFEELFTHNTAEEQARFAELLGRLPIEANVHVLICLRDDFLAQCNDHPPLAPMLPELTLLTAPQGMALRRALVQPALVSGFRFEDEALVDDMIGEVSDERGALPLLAFAAARLWDKREREAGLLTRKAYEEIGGVGGALAQHAEATLERIGMAREPLVRELLRNLVTAQGTRAIRDRKDLLSVFEDRHAAEQVLQALIDARLLTSFEVPGADADSEPSHRIEIIHESLLAAWPRLVRWQTQDADGAQLRDQLRQVAKMWEDRGQPSDLLWTGPSLKEYQAWRERYSGGLSTTEGAFVRAMVHRAGQQRRRWTVAVAALLIVLTSGLAVVERARETAVDEARRAEASKLTALAHVELEKYPTGAFAYALKSLETYDNEEARRFVVEVLQRGPLALIAPLEAPNYNVAVSPNGEWIALNGKGNVSVLHRSGGPPRHLLARSSSLHHPPAFTPRSDRLFLGGEGDEIQSWSLPELEELEPLAFEGPTRFFVRGDRLVTITQGREEGSDATVESRRLDEGVSSVSTLLGRTPRAWAKHPGVRLDPSGARLALPLGNEELHLLQLSPSGVTPSARLVGRHPEDLYYFDGVAFHPRANAIVSQDAAGVIRLWSLEPSSGTRPLRTWEGPKRYGHPRFSPDGSLFALRAANVLHVWNLDAPAQADPFVMRQATQANPYITFGPEGRWIVAANAASAVFWPLSHRYPRVMRGLPLAVRHHFVAFTPDGAGVLTGTQADGVRLWPVSFQDGKESRYVISDSGMTAMDPTGKYVVAEAPDFSSPSARPRMVLAPIEPGPLRKLPDSTEAPGILFPRLTFDLRGRLVATAPGRGPRDAKVIRIWDLESGEQRVLGPLAGADEDLQGGFYDLGFASDGRLISLSPDGLRGWRVEDGTPEVLKVGTDWDLESTFGINADGRRLLLAFAPRHATKNEFELAYVDLETGDERPLTSHGGRVRSVALNAAGTLVVTGDRDGVVRVGSASGEEPHLLYGHGDEVFAVAVSPDEEWIASVAGDGTLRLWPMPKGPPLHTLPYEELLAKLRTLTNLRAVEDDSAPSGYRFEVGPFPGWAEVPDW